jgi:hypothetical protein
MVVGQDSGSKTIVRGEEWHKECYERAHPARGPSGGLKQQVMHCPGCKAAMVVGQDSGNKTIVRGEEWHKECYERAHPARGPSGGLQQQISYCPGCGAGMVVGQDSANKTIVRGEEWHTECYRKKSQPSCRCGEALQPGQGFCSGCGARVAA